MLEALNKFLGDWQYIWFFVILSLGLLVEIHSNYMLRKEYEYDENKDLEKKQRRTKTTKKTTNKNGESIVEESTETSEPVQESTK